MLNKRVIQRSEIRKDTEGFDAHWQEDPQASDDGARTHKHTHTYACMQAHTHAQIAPSPVVPFQTNTLQSTVDCIHDARFFLRRGLVVVVVVVVVVVFVVVAAAAAESS